MDYLFICISRSTEVRQEPKKRSLYEETSSRDRADRGERYGKVAKQSPISESPQLIQ